MELQNQSEALTMLERFVEHRQHTIIISGPHGSGKTYLARKYSQLMGADCVEIEPKIQNIRDTIESVIDVENPVVIVIENIDTAPLGSSYVLLKFIEEPKENVYIIITCRNICKVPDTIQSRGMHLNLHEVSDSDLQEYAKLQNSSIVKVIESDLTLWQSLRSFSDIDHLINAGVENIQYYRQLPGLITANSSASWTSWKLQKYPDDKPTELPIVIRYLMYHNSKWLIPCLTCLRTLDNSSISQNVVLSKMILTIKYGGYI